MIDSLIGVNA